MDKACYNAQCLRKDAQNGCFYVYLYYVLP